MTAANHESDPLTKYLNELQPLREEIIERLKTETFKIAVRKNEVLPNLSDISGDCLFFIVKGLVRAFVLDDGKDITAWLTDENHLIGSIRNPGTLIPTYQEQYQALEDSELLILPYRFIDDMYLQFPETNILARKLLAIHYHMSQERSILSRIPSAEVRYKQFKIGYPTIKSRVPLKFLASYLGMRIETLSRIRKKEKLEEKS
ncbi:Crp/Fnr family transcriptional regulator [Pedobacter psychrodurus]|uniref:Crp/Fnr family transcriptional regulator n=1 Tax=Pedobacter psychrodurus TaxID=2530456 RepID=A0A4R0PY90_9SPHI|nr:Crp/Fnr family transcriptional regulator [Pedobacter psychrodurus]TCD26354.1 Crp/Fnr family transcriptional regulator [Pedobacter psychrodurus]